MRTLAIALLLGLFTVGTAEAAPRHHGRHGKKHHSRSVKHAKRMSKHGVKRA